MKGLWIRAARLAIGVLVVGAAVAWLVGCSSSPTDGGNGNETGYFLRLLLEKNLDLDSDVVYIEFRRDGKGIPGGRVAIGTDTVDIPSTSGKLLRTYAFGRWAHLQMVRIAAIDTGGGFTYRDSVRIPGSELRVENIRPSNRLWSGGTVTVEWAGSTGASAYGLSVKPKTPGSDARGLALSNLFGTNSNTFEQTVFENQFGIVQPDTFYIHVLAYAPNYLPRDGANYKTPPADIATQISRTGITGALAALVVAVHDSVIVPQQ